MTLLRALCIAFSTYSKIPVPQVEWNERNMRHSLCFFPLVGVAVGGLLVFWVWVCGILSIGPVLKGAVGALIPLAVSGGIHMDGFMDTADALASHAEREKKLLILKDSHVGAFGVLCCAGYLLLMAGVVSELSGYAFGAVFVVSRALSALALVTLPSASQGLLKAFADSAGRRAVRWASALYALAFGGLGVWLAPLPGLAGLLALGVCWLCYRRMAMRQFGGLTGDLAGWFVTLCEAAYLLAFVIVGRFA